MARKVLWAVWVGLVAGGAAWGADEAARPEKRQGERPAAWRAVGAQDRIKACRVAEVDAAALLAERIYGLKIDADTTVLDLVLADDKMSAELSAAIRGVATVGERYTDDLAVEVTRQITVRETIETITRTLRRTNNPLGVREEQLANVAQETRDTVIAATGSGAVEGSKGLRMSQAKRAAELDAYRKLAERIMETEISRTTKVQDFALASDKIALHVAAVLKGSAPTRVVYDDEDCSCEVTMRVTLREVIETVRRASQRYTRGGKVTEDEWRKVETEVGDRFVEETGRGAPRQQGAGAADVLEVAQQPFCQEVQIIRHVVQREIGVVP